MLCQYGSRKPEATTMLLIVLRLITPNNVPITLPTPPESRVPPMIEEAIACIHAGANRLGVSAGIAVVDGIKKE